MSDYSAFVLVVFIILMIVGGGAVVWQFNKVEEAAEGHKSDMRAKHTQLTADLDALTTTLDREIETLKKSTDEADASLLQRLSTQQSELHNLKLEVGERLVKLEEYDELSKASLDKAGALLEEMSASMQTFVTELNELRSGQTDINTGVQSKLDSIDTQLTSISGTGDRMSSDIQLVEGRLQDQQSVTNDLSRKVGRFKFDDVNNAVYVCGVESNNCRQLQYLAPVDPQPETVPLTSPPLTV